LDSSCEDADEDEDDFYDEAEVNQAREGEEDLTEQVN
jgi:hypothetical protein